GIILSHGFHRLLRTIVRINPCNPRLKFLVTSGAATTKVVIDNAFQNPIEAHVGPEPDKLADLRDVRHASRHVLKSFLVRLVVRHKHDLRIRMRDLLYAFGELEY